MGAIGNCNPARLDLARAKAQLKKPFAEGQIKVGILIRLGVGLRYPIKNMLL